MRICLFSVRLGRRHSPALEGLTAGYLQRLALPWSSELRSFNAESALLSAITAARRAHAATVWWLEQGGRPLSSEAVAKSLGALRLTGQRYLIAAVGPPDGWSESARGSVTSQDMLLSLGPMTLPHELARLVVAEQLYRAVTILSGHPYHLGHE